MFANNLQISEANWKRLFPIKKLLALTSSFLASRDSFTRFQFLYLENKVNLKCVQNTKRVHTCANYGWMTYKFSYFQFLSNHTFVIIVWYLLIIYIVHTT